MPISTTYLDERIAATEASIVFAEAALDKLLTNGQSYRLDTSQTAQSVTQASLGEMRRNLDSLENRLATLCARRDGSSFYGRFF